MFSAFDVAMPALFAHLCQPAAQHFLSKFFSLFLFEQEQMAAAHTVWQFGAVFAK